MFTSVLLLELNREALLPEVPLRRIDVYTGENCGSTRRWPLLGVQDGENEARADVRGEAMVVPCRAVPCARRVSLARAVFPVCSSS